MNSRTVTDYVNQTKITHLPTGECTDGWRDTCHGHQTMDGALECKKIQQDYISGKEAHAVNGEKFPGDLTVMKYEQRIVKRDYSMTETVVAEPETVKPHSH